MDENCSTKRVKIGLIGARGRMGQLVLELAKADPLVCLNQNDPDVVIDFSTPEGTKKAVALGKPLVCGTTGLDDEILNQLKKLSDRVPVLYAPNFSLGVALCMKMLKELYPHLKIFSSIEIEETHHIHKKDAPSGTALKLASILETKQITSHREGEVVGTHKVLLKMAHETITLTHEAHSRKIFAQGALEAAKFIINKPPKLYSLDEVYS